MDVLDGMSGVERTLVDKATRNRIPISAAFELTPLCNMNCRMCFLRMSKKQQESIGPLHDAQAWLALAEEMQKMGNLFILLTGGEPLLHPGFAEIYQGLKKLGIYITINTNGTLLTPQLADMMAADLPRRVNITLYGASRETYGRICGYENGFDQTIDAIRMLTQRNVPVKINGSLTPENRDEMQRLMDIADELGAPIEINTYMFPCDRKHCGGYPEDVRVSAQEAAEAECAIRKRQLTDEAWKRMTMELAYYRDHHFELPVRETKMVCRAGKSNCWFTWQGHMSPCVFLEKPGYPVLDGYDVSAAWKQIVAFCDEVQLYAGCESCVHRHSCGVCAARTYWEGGAYDEKPEYLCQYTAHLNACILREAGEENT